MKPADQDAVWDKIGYRGPQDLVVRSYALPKLDLVEGVLPFRGYSVLDVGCGPGLMLAFLAMAAHEQGGVKFSRRYLEGLLRQADLLPLRFWTTGMITQNYTPKCLVPLLKRFDFDFPLGEYHVTVALKRPGKINR